MGPTGLGQRDGLEMFDAATTTRGLASRQMTASDVEKSRAAVVAYIAAGAEGTQIAERAYHMETLMGLRENLEGARPEAGEELHLKEVQVAAAG